jgi:hypothetical protein
VRKKIVRVGAIGGTVGRRCLECVLRADCRCARNARAADGAEAVPRIQRSLRAHHLRLDLLRQVGKHLGGLQRPGVPVRRVFTRLRQDDIGCTGSQIVNKA